jgi:hypothetical protein
MKGRWIRKQGEPGVQCWETLGTGEVVADQAEEIERAIAEAEGEMRHALGQQGDAVRVSGPGSGAGADGRDCGAGTGDGSACGTGPRPFGGVAGARRGQGQLATQATPHAPHF